MGENKAILLKVCGMREPDNIRDVMLLQPDFMGFIFFNGSKRYVGADFIMSEDFSVGVKKVGVFVNDPPEKIIEVSKKYHLEYVQLHGDEGPAYCEVLRHRGLRIIKAFAVSDDFNFNHVNPFREYVDYVLFDAKGPARGGNGVSFNWSVLKRYDQSIPFFLSGGIAPANIRDLTFLKGMNLKAIDVNSGVERAPGCKDLNLIRDVKQKLSEL